MAQIEASEVIAGGGPGDFALVRHVRLEGTQAEIGASIAGLAWANHGVRPQPSTDPALTRARRRWREVHWPQLEERARGVAGYWGLADGDRTETVSVRSRHRETGRNRRERKETTMAAEQGKDTPAGKMPALNIERIYSTAIPADELARAVADHFRAKEFEAQVFRTSGDRTVMQARKESLWRNLLGVAYALTVVFTPGEGQLSIGLGGHEWVDAAVSGAIGLVAVPPVLLGTAYGIWKENQLDKEVWQVIDERVSAPAEEQKGG